MKYEDFIHTSVSGDGSCFFHALSHILALDSNNEQGKTIKEKDKYRNDLSKKLREQCVDWLERNLTYRIKDIGLTIKEEIEEDISSNNKLKSVGDYLNYMRKKTAYAGQIEIYAMSNILKRNIRVYTRIKGEFRNIGLGYQINPKKDIMKDIQLYHNLGTSLSPGLHHFEPLYPKKKFIENNKQKTKTKKLSKKRQKTKTKTKTKKRQKTKTKKRQLSKKRQKTKTNKRQKTKTKKRQLSKKRQTPIRKS